jgi:hypothetical protein
MALTDFFNINLPYGLRRNSKNQWIAFNREYLPLSWSNDDDVTQTVGHNDVYPDMPLYTGYPKLSEALLKKIAWGEEGIRRDDKGKIYMVFLYCDGINPKFSSKHWKIYFDKIKMLCDLRPEGK